MPKSSRAPGPSKIRESAITGRTGGIVIPVGIIDYDDTNARIITEASGINVRQGERHTVPISALLHINEYVD